MKPVRIVPRLVALAAGILILWIGPETAFADKDSGFLSDYSRLEKEKDPLGVKRKVWISPALEQGNYQAVLLTPVTFYPPPEPTKEISADVLEELRQYIDATMRKSIGSELALADESGPGVLRLRIAITAVDLKKGLKPFQILPSAMIRQGIKEAAGVRDHPVELFVEAELADSVSTAILAMGVRQAKGIKMDGRRDHLTLEDAKPSIDEWGESLRQMIVKILK